MYIRKIKEREANPDEKSYFACKRKLIEIYLLLIQCSMNPF